MDYHFWIDRERRVRAKILKSSPLAIDSSYRVCLDCDEVCLCHEDICPNCGSTKTEFQEVEKSSLAKRIRCKQRYKKINEEKNSEIR
jgi:RNA polymerase subunit RPABC4/transcription elongation factor Spt4